MLSSILGSFGQAFNAMWSTVTGFVGQAATDLGLAVSGTFTAAVDAAESGIGNLGNALASTSAWFQMQLNSLATLVNGLQSDIAGWLSVTSERARQYQLARLRKNPLAVLLEPLLAVQRVSPAYTPPDPRPAAPWELLEELRADLRAFAIDPAHPVRQALDEVVAEMRAWQRGQPVAVPPWPARPQDVPGFPMSQDPAGADPNASALLTPADQAYVTSTTGGAA